MSSLTLLLFLLSLSTHDVVHGQINALASVLEFVDSPDYDSKHGDETSGVLERPLESKFAKT